jgi:2-haloacid dehalogenase
MLDFSQKEVLSFDCYGTLIDWETGLSEVLRPILERHGIKLETEQMLEEFGRYEAQLEAGPYQTYRQILAGVLQNFGQHYQFQPTEQELEQFSNSVGDWPAFADSPSALAALKQRFRLAIISNVDDDLFARSNQKLGVEFDWIITAQQVQSYKPSKHNFEVAFARIGLPTSRWVHVAQSLFHDHLPAKELGLETVWVNRRQGKAGGGATPPAQAAPDLEVPDLATLARLVGLG